MKSLRTLRPLLVASLLGISYIAQAQFQMERLSRGVIAVRNNGSQVYIGWRLFGTDASGTAFNLGTRDAIACVLRPRGVAQNITFQPTGAWTTWSNQNVTVTLNNNATNVIRFESNGQELANVDEVEIL